MNPQTPIKPHNDPVDTGSGEEEEALDCDDDEENDTFSSYVTLDDVTVQLNWTQLLILPTCGTMILTLKWVHNLYKRVRKLTFPSERRKAKVKAKVKARADILFARQHLSLKDRRRRMEELLMTMMNNGWAKPITGQSGTKSSRAECIVICCKELFREIFSNKFYHWPRQRVCLTQLHVLIKTWITGEATHTRGRHTVSIVELTFNLFREIHNALEATRSSSSYRNEELADVVSRSTTITKQQVDLGITFVRWGVWPVSDGSTFPGLSWPCNSGINCIYSVSRAAPCISKTTKHWIYE